MTQLSQHSRQRWNELGLAGQLALIAVVVGDCVVVAATWVGVRHWWRQWKKEMTEEP